MNAKKRLEEINQRIFYMKRKSGMPGEVLTLEGWKEVTVLFKEDYKYLQEQVERVQELKKELEDTVRQEIRYSMRLETQNKRYREALETIEMVTEFKSEANEIANKVLEGDDEE